MQWNSVLGVWTAPNKNGNKKRKTLSRTPEEIPEPIERHENKDVSDCAICLNPVASAAFLPMCFHSFCYPCIKQWSEIGRKCPLCKKEFSCILKDVKGDQDYTEEQLPTLEARRLSPPRNPPPSISSHSINWHGRRRRANVNPIRWGRRSNSCAQTPFYLRSFERTSNSDESLQRQANSSATPASLKTPEHDFRRAVYDTNIKAVPMTPSPGSTVMKRRAQHPPMGILRWLKRELQCITNKEDVLILCHHVHDIMMRSKDSEIYQNVKNDLKPFLAHYTEIFVHEFKCVCNSPVNLMLYDRTVKYETAQESRQRKLRSVQTNSKTSSSSHNSSRSSRNSSSHSSSSSSQNSSSSSHNSSSSSHNPSHLQQNPSSSKHKPPSLRRESPRHILSTARHKPPTSKYKSRSSERNSPSPRRSSEQTTSSPPRSRHSSPSRHRPPSPQPPKHSSSHPTSKRRNHRTKKRRSSSIEDISTSDPCLRPHVVSKLLKTRHTTLELKRQKRNPGERSIEDFEQELLDVNDALSAEQKKLEMLLK